MLYEDVMIYENSGGSPDKTVGKAGSAYINGNTLVCIMVEWRGKSGSSNVFRKLVVRKKKRAPKLVNNLLAGDTYQYYLEVDKGNGLKKYFRANLIESSVNTAVFSLDHEQVAAELRSMRVAPQIGSRRRGNVLQPAPMNDHSEEILDEDIDALVNDLMGV